MCGIAGFHRQGDSDQWLSKLELCSKSLSHRGPDHTGTYHKGDVYISHTRLKIIDLSDMANQPMAYDNGNIIISLNGEIYNYKTLKAELSDLGYRFNTKSDTEVIAAAYKQWGVACLERLDGMFALAIYDLENEKIHLARDIFGKKPLYYSLKDGLSFSSELSVFRLLYKDLSLSLESLNHFLSIGYILHPLSPYNDIFTVPPATCMTYDLRQGAVTFSAYYNYADAFRNKSSMNESDRVNQIKTLLKEAVNKRLTGDVPMGIFLSGGIDSAGIAAYCHDETGDLPCFTVAFPGTIYNEQEYAANTASFLNMNHHVLSMTDVNEHDIATFISGIDYTTFDNSAYPLYRLSSMASRYVKFVLTGDGSDEIFSGYPTYIADRYNSQIKAIIPALKKTGLASLLVNMTNQNNDKVGPMTKFNRFFNGMDTDPCIAHYNWRNIFSPEERVNILGREHEQLIWDTDPLYRFKAHYSNVSDLEPTDQHLYVDAMTWLTDNNLVKLDRSTMAHGLEARSPYLDKALSSFLAGCPCILKQEKLLLKKALDGILPDHVIKRKKTGFNAPVAKWFGRKENEFQSYTRFVFDHQFHHH